MTWTVQKGEYEKDSVTVQYMYGPVVIKMTEHKGHARSFLNELTRVLDSLDDQPTE